MRDARKSAWWSWVVVVCLLGVAWPACADDDEEPEEPSAEEPAEPAEADGDEVALEPAEAQRAKELCEDLKKASKAKQAKDALDALEAIDGLAHESFEKPLLKLMTHDDSSVAVRATTLLEERRNEKLLKKMWKGLGHKSNDRRYEVRAIVYRTSGRDGPLDKKGFKELERDWRFMIGNPDEGYAPALVTICAYAKLSKDKRMARMLAEELDEPVAANPNSPTNPPAEWWERRWTMWKPVKAPAASALAVLTGQEFETTAQAKEWIEANTDAGFDW